MQSQERTREQVNAEWLKAGTGVIVVGTRERKNGGMDERKRFQPASSPSVQLESRSTLPDTSRALASSLYGGGSQGEGTRALF